MSPHATLAQLTLDWCVREVFGDAQGLTESGGHAAGLAALSREAMRSAGVALLQAAAGELSETNQDTLARIAAALEDDAALSKLEEALALAARGQSGQCSTSAGRQRFVGTHFQLWLDGQLPPSGLPSAMKSWLAQGWPDTTVRGGVLSFYQAYCRTLHRIVRRDQATVDALLLGSVVDAASWRQWLIREGEPRADAIEHRTSRRAGIAFAMILLLIGATATGVWKWWKSITEQSNTGQVVAMGSEASHDKAFTEPAAASPARTAPATEPSTASPSPSAAPAAEIARPPSISPAPPSDTPSPTATAKPELGSLADIKRLLDETDRAMLSGKPEGSEQAARQAQEHLDSRLPAHDADLGDALERLGMYWEWRGEWAQAVRVHQAAVRAYEKTPAENATPQLQAVNRWAGALRHTGRNTEAERLYRTLLEAYQSAGPALQPDAATVAHNLANVLYASGRLREARTLYAQALSLVASVPADPAGQRLLEPLKNDYAQCLRALGVSELQIDADTRKALADKPGASPSPNP